MATSAKLTGTRLTVAGTYAKLSGSRLTVAQGTYAKMSGSTLSVGATAAKMSGSVLTIPQNTYALMQGGLLYSPGSTPPGRYRYINGAWQRVRRYRYINGTWVLMEFGPTPAGTPVYVPPQGGSGIPMPVGDLDAHFQQVSAEDFLMDIPLGTFVTQDSKNSKIISTDPVSLYYKDRIRMYQAGHPDTSQVGVYDPAQFSATNSIITLNMAYVNGVATGGQIHPVIAGQTGDTGAFRLPTAGGRYDIMMRFNATGTHWGGVTFFISTGNFETDWSEGSSASQNIQGFHHNTTTGQQSLATVNGKSRHDWHKYSVIYIPNTSVQYLLDDVVIYTITTGVGSDRVSFNFQAATDGTLPPTGTTGTIDIDWMVVYQYNP